MARFGGYSYPLWLKRAVRPAVLRVRYAGLRPEDVILASYPRSGSTWLRCLLTESLIGRAAEWRDVNRLIPYVGGHRDMPSLLPGSGRLVKTHDPDPGPCRRGVFLVRDPRDVVVSEYRWRVRGEYSRDFETFLRGFLNGSISLFGSWGDNTRYWLDSGLRREGRLYLARFEDLRADPAKTVSEILAFVGAVVNEEAVDAAVAGNTIERSREKEERWGTRVRRFPTWRRFVGEGSVGGWRSTLTDEQALRMEDRTGDLLDVLGYARRGPDRGNHAGRGRATGGGDVSPPSTASTGSTDPMLK